LIWSWKSDRSSGWLVDALTISMARMPAAGIAPNVAAEAIAIGILANCVLKLGLAVVYGTPAFRRLTSAALSSAERAALSRVMRRGSRRVTR
jgi:uncharacterized membrane protein (DUF4010 family)